MNERGNDRREHSEKGKRDAGGIDEDRAPEIEHDYAIAAFADREHFHET